MCVMDLPGNPCADVVNVEELSTEGFDLYPNPTAGNVKITTSSLMDKIVVRNILGEIVEVIQTPSSTQVEVNSQKLETGVYFVTVYAGNQQMTQKFIKE
jgi:hypothetical protein